MRVYFTAAPLPAEILKSITVKTAAGAVFKVENYSLCSVSFSMLPAKGRKERLGKGEWQIES
jgi:predicted transcriptional regulator of viral defense system